MNRFCIVLFVFLLAGCDVKVDHDTSIEWLKAPGTEDMNLPFSAAVRVDNTLYLSGALGYDREAGGLVEGGIQPETRKTLENISATLEQFGSSMDRVVKCTVFLADIGEWAAMNEVYVEFFPNKPARSALGASGLALNARVEIECIAVVN
ncbi:MAG: Rid family hydrolase [Woeseiaceae bacterium]|jgi:2-iminobutanoate/2-iminopropanoate deaminase